MIINQEKNHEASLPRVPAKYSRDRLQNLGSRC